MDSKDKHYFANRDHYRRKGAVRACASNALTIDEEVPLMGRAKWERMRLGLALLGNRSIPGVGHCVEDMALWAGCTYQAIGNIEARALRKVKAWLEDRPQLREEFLAHLQNAPRRITGKTL